jgi:energy-coupling factor transport system ATP-binding protein
MKVIINTSRPEYESKECIIKTEHLGFTYSDGTEEVRSKDQIPALRDVNLEISRGEYIAVLGHNGSGKSTLAKLLNLILTPTVGKIYIDGVDITREDFTEDDVFAIRRKVGMVFQNPDNQIVATIVEEDVAFGPENLGLPREEIRRRVDEALATVGMTEYKDHAPHKLSGGQKQRVAIAGIIAMKPEVIIFDESTAMLDPRGRREVVDVMERLNREESITVLNITHYMEEAARADRVIVINDGKIVLDGTPREVFSNVSLLHSIGLEVPQSNELVTKLREAGCNIVGESLTEKECIETLAGFLKR